MPADYHPLGIAIAEDPAGRPLIAYQAWNTSLKLARPLAALGIPPGGGNCGPEDLFLTWYCDTIDEHGSYITWRHGDYVSLDISPTGLAQIAYYGFIKDDSGNLRVAYQEPFRIYLPVIMKNY
jgi:hypothetical protein